MSRLRPKEQVIKQLFALSGNLCAFPGCGERLVDEDGDLIGEICHIEAAEPGGERYNPDQNDEERRSFENLILLCRNHHAKTNNVAKHTVESLRKIKVDHENRFKDEPYVIPEDVEASVLLQITRSLDKIYSAIKESHSEIIAVNNKVSSTAEAVTEMTALMKTIASPDGTFFQGIYADQLRSILELRNNGKSKSALEALRQFKATNWEKVKDELKFKIQANLGVLLLDLGFKLDAANTLIEIAQLRLETCDSLSFLCLGYSMQQNSVEFDKVFSKAMALGCTHPNMWVSYIEIKKSTTPMDEILESIPKGFHTIPELMLSIGLGYVAQNDVDKGIPVLERFLSLVSPKDTSALNARAILITRKIQKVILWENVPLGNLSSIEKKALNDLIDETTQLLADFEETNLNANAWSLRINRAVCYASLGKNSDALADYLYTWTTHKSIETFRNLLSHCLDTNNLELAEKIIAEKDQINFTSEDERITADIFACRALIASGKGLEARAAVDSFVSRSKGEIRRKALNSAVLLLSVGKDLNGALHYAKIAISEFPDYPESYISIGSIYAALGDIVSAKRSLHNAGKILESGRHQTILWIQLGTELYHLKDFKKAAACLEKYPVNNTFNEVNKMLLECYYLSGDFENAIKLAEQLLTAGISNSIIYEILISALGKKNKMLQAETYLKQALKNEQGVSNQLRFIGVQLYVMLKNFNQAADLAKHFPNFDGFDMKQTFFLSSVLIEHGGMTEGLELAYNTRLQFFDKMEAHQAYQSLLRMKADKRERMYPIEVEMECGVILQDGRGLEKTYFLTDDIRVSGPEILRFGNPMTALLLTKKKGDKVINPGVVGSGHTSIIKEIMDKHTYAFRQTLTILTTTFGGISGMVMGKFGD